MKKLLSLLIILCFLITAHAGTPAIEVSSQDEFYSIAYEQLTALADTFTITYPEELTNYSAMSQIRLQMDDYQRHNAQNSGFLRRKTDSGYTYEFKAYYIVTIEQQKYIDTKINEFMDRLTGKTEYQKVTAIHDYILQNVSYDYMINPYCQFGNSPYFALKDGKTKCLGYSMLFFRMAQMADIQSKIICGSTPWGAHAWNIVKIGDKWYNIDCTWDDAGFTRQWFLKGSTFPSHTRYKQYDTAEFNAKYIMSEVNYDLSIQAT